MERELVLIGLTVSYLVIASVSDIRTKTVDDHISVALAIIGLIGFRPENLWGLIPAIIMFAVAYSTNGRPGDADIKVFAALTLSCGLWKSMFITAWRNLVERHIGDIAKAQKIAPSNIRWYAAFHNKESNPHVHIVVYSTDKNEGYLSKQGIDEIRSAFANDIYHDVLYHLYEKQTALRDKLRSDSAELMRTLMSKLQDGTYSNPELESLVQKLSEQLKHHKGKKQYGYLQPNVKKTVDSIVLQLSKNDDIAKMYKEWCELEQDKYSTYTNELKTFPPLHENKVFKPIKNRVIDIASNMTFN